MNMSDPIADMLTRIRNANTAKHDEWMKRNKDKPITLDSKFYAEQNTKTDKEVQDEFNRLRAQLFGA